MTLPETSEATVWSVELTENDLKSLVAKAVAAVMYTQEVKKKAEEPNEGF